MNIFQLIIDISKYMAIVIGLVVIATMLFWPPKWSVRFPASLLGIILATLLNWILGWSTKMIGEIKSSYTTPRVDRLNDVPGNVILQI